ncbi:BatA and WFA domain-containing protein [uncultured Akkermansia sp.]|uniref:vWA domain-containing protein n=1 Tax=Akkermansia sp. TaxID=1872421 RepID=UPI0025DA1A34|nr:BatA and WFA domain-containing protein [uncultured Akkermansia sp.]
MNLFFSNPLFWLMAAAAVPLLVHLFARSRPREREFSSLIFLRRAVKRHVRLRRPKDWLLLAVRTLAAACLAAAFLLPYMAGRSMEEQGSRSVILVVDRSASMSAADGQESRISKAGVFAGQIMSDLKREDLVNLIWADAAPAALFREPMPSHDLVNRELQRIHSRPEAANTAAALALAVEQAARTASTRPTSVYILSDFQSSNWSGVDWEKAFPPDLDVRCIQVAVHECLPNTAVTSLKVMPATVLPGQSVTVQAVLSNFGSQPVRVTAHLEAGSLRASRTAEIPAGAKETVSFQAQVPSSVEEWPVFVTLDHDAFPADDTAGTVVRVGASLECDAVTQDEAQLGFMMKALRFIPFLDVQSAGGLGREQPDFIVWNKPEKEDLKKMEALAEAGSVIVAVPDFSGDAVANALMGLPDGPRTFSEYEKTGKGWTLNAALPDDPVFDLFRGGDAASPLDARVFRRLNEGLAPDSWNDLVSVLVRYEDGVPAIARRAKGRGALVLWNVPVQSMDADWGKSPLFLPFLAEAMLKSRQEGVGEAAPEPGRDFPSWILPDTLDAADVVLTGPDGAELLCKESRLSSGKRLLSSITPAVPGTYVWSGCHAAGMPLHTQVVNFPAGESNLQTLAAGNLPASAAVVTASGKLVEVTGRIPLWPWLLGAAVLLLALELRLSSLPVRTVRDGKEAQS